MGIPVTSLCHYIYGEEAVDRCLPEEAEKGLFTIVRYHAFNELVTFEPRCEKTGLRGFRPGPTQTGLCSHRRCLEA